MSPQDSDLEHAHTRAAIRRRLSERTTHSYLRDWVYGGMDGAVTTFAVVSGVTGAALDSRVVVILGIANLIADGFSMAASNYLGTVSERQQVEHAENVERRHIKVTPEGEREEVREIFRRKGIDGDDLEALVDRITADRDLWIRTMVSEEYGLPLEIRSPWRAGLATLSAFIICGGIPMLPYLLALPNTFAIAALLTAAVFLAIGAMRAQWVARGRLRAAFETLGVGAAAAMLAYLSGRIIEPFV